MDDATFDDLARAPADGRPFREEDLALALHRIYGLPMMAEYEVGAHGRRSVRGGLVRAWVRLPDGRALDASGPREMVPTEGGDPDDPWVQGYRISDLPARGIAGSDGAGVEAASEWIEGNLAGMLRALGIEPVIGRPALPPLVNRLPPGLLTASSSLGIR